MGNKIDNSKKDNKIVSVDVFADEPIKSEDKVDPKLEEMANKYFEEQEHEAEQQELLHTES